MGFALHLKTIKFEELKCSRYDCERYSGCVASEEARAKKNIHYCTPEMTIVDNGAELQIHCHSVFVPLRGQMKEEDA